MRIEVKGRNVPVTDGLRKRVDKRFEKIARQVSDQARLEVELIEEQQRSAGDTLVAEAKLHLKGVTLRARGASPDIARSINVCGDQLAIQVKRHRDKRRGRRDTRGIAAASQPAAPM